MGHALSGTADRPSSTGPFTTHPLSRPPMEIQLQHTRIVVRQGDLATTSADAVVNAANSALEPGGGVCGALHAAAGPALVEACNRLRESQGQCAVGDAVVTEAGNLPAKHVIHAVGPVWHDGQRGENIQLERAWQRALLRAREIGARTVAFPAISTGIYGFPVEPAALIALNAVAREVQATPEAFDEIAVILYDQPTFEVFRKTLVELERTMVGTPQPA